VSSSFEFLTVAEVEQIHAEQLRLFGGLDGIRDRAVLEAAVAVPSSSFGGEFLHEGIFQMAAAYAYHIAENQPFIDGNKRTALNAALLFLGLHEWDIADPDGQLYEGMIGIAERRVTKSDFALLLERLAVRVVED
jgi:death-on-curing protein